MFPPLLKGHFTPLATRSYFNDVWDTINTLLGFFCVQSVFLDILLIRNILWRGTRHNILWRAVSLPFRTTWCLSQNSRKDSPKGRPQHLVKPWTFFDPPTSLPSDERRWLYARCWVGGRWSGRRHAVVSLVSKHCCKVVSHFVITIISRAMCPWLS